MDYYMVLSSVLLAALYAFLVPVSSGKAKLPHGPSRLPWIGNAFTLWRLHVEPDQELIRLARKWGSMCMLWCGMTPIVILSTPQAVCDLLTTRGSIYSSRPETNNFRSQMWPWRLVVLPMGDRFRFLRKLYREILSPQQSGLMRTYQDYESKAMLQDLLDEPDHFLRHTDRYAISVMFSAVYGVRLAMLDHPVMREFFHLWAEMFRYIQPGSLLVDFFPMLQKLPLWLQPWQRLANRLRQRETALHMAFLRNLQHASQTGQAPDCFGKTVLEMQAETDIADEPAADILAMLIGAGSETTSSAVQWFFRAMALHPDVLRSAQDELDRVVGGHRLPGWHDEAALPYVRGLIKELHRWAPLLTLGMPHATTADDVYDGRLITKGTIIFPNISQLHNDPQRYPDPVRFEPRRFHNDDMDASVSARQRDPRHRDHYGYGFGRRLCPGIHVAEASLFIVIARVLWGFEIRPKSGQVLEPWAKSSGEAVKPKPFELDIRCRGPAYEATLRQARCEAKTAIVGFDDVCLA
ncbi:MAG: hypothetical protein M1826_002906 [Phylliscum demangeonii]|nr:MAG: hypothetical protein M1826_002906 [Phylliscum demangeonii]